MVPRERGLDKGLPTRAKSEVQLPFVGHDVLEFIDLEEKHIEQQLRHVTLANPCGFF